MRTVIVTGASGFIGGPALQALRARGYQVHAIARRPPPRRLVLEGVTWHQADLLDRGQCESVISTIAASHLLHLAWFSEHGRFWDAPENDAWCDASGYLVDCFVREGGERMVATGTCAEYDWSDPGLVEASCEESAPCRPRTRYGAAKLRSGQALMSRTDLSVAWARLFHLFGAAEDERRLVPSLIGSLLRGQRAELGPGTAVRDFTDTRDVGAALAAVLSDEVTGPINVASGVGTRIADVALSIGTLLGRRELVAIGALPERANEPPRLVADVRRLQAVAGLQPMRPMTQGLTDAIDWWRHRLSKMSASLSTSGEAAS